MREPLIDGLKAAACLTIVAHHQCFYGPLLGTLLPAAPPWLQVILQGLADPARMAVQIFLVIGGYLAAASLAPRGQPVFGQWWRVVLMRYARLVVPLMVAVSVCAAIAAAVRPFWDDPSVGAPVTWGQWLAHAALLQDLLGWEALSAGVWYVAIDWQLYVLFALLLSLGARHHRAAMLSGGAWALLAGAVASLWFFNRSVQWDATALYFLGAYGLGAGVWWARQLGPRERQRLVGAATVALGLALALEWRTRLLVAGATALLLLVAPQGRPTRDATIGRRWVDWVSDRSYAIFLIHFSVVLVINAIIATQWPLSVPAAASGLLIGLALSVAAGHLLHEAIEKPWLSRLKLWAPARYTG